VGDYEDGKKPENTPGLRTATIHPTDLWNLRIKYNLTCAQLAEIVGVHKSQVTRWETGKQKIPPWLSNLLRYWEQSKDHSD